MKPNFLYTVLIASLFFFSCSKEDDRIFEESPDERLSAILNTYQEQLVNAENGWKAIVTTAAGGTYSFYFDFNDQNRVVMFSDFDSAAAVTSKESSYRLKALQQPSLVFDTYSYIHELADPDPGVNGGTVGQGLRSDFEFYFDSVTADTIRLVGRFNGSRAVLVRATQAEANAYNNKEFTLVFRDVSKILSYFKRLNLGGQQYEVSTDFVNRTITFTWLDGNGNLLTFTTGFYFTLGGIRFTNPLVNGSQTITGFTNMEWNEVTEALTVTSGNVTGTITGVGRPLRVDVNAPRRWWQRSVDQDTYWVSVSGFTVNGVVDAYGLTSIPDFAFLLFWARYGTSGTINYDLQGYVTSDGNSLALGFGAAFMQPTFTTDGRIIFPILGTLGTVPPEYEMAFANTNNQMLESSGYYLIQTGENTFDMVSAKDGKAWITWEW